MAAGKLTIYEPYDIVQVLSSAGGADSGLPNLFSDDPKEIWNGGAATQRNLYIDLGVAQAVDSIFIGYTNFTTAQVNIAATTDMSGNGAVQAAPVQAIRAADAKTVRSSKIIPLTTPTPVVTSRYWRIIISADVAAHQVGRIAFCRQFSAEWDREWGSGRRPIDTGRSTALLGGGFATQDGARKASYNWTFGDLTEAELETLWGIFLRRGTTKPIIVSELEGAATGPNEKLHYGLFQRLDPWERREPNATKWSMEVEEWI